MVEALVQSDRSSRATLLYHLDALQQAGHGGSAGGAFAFGKRTGVTAFQAFFGLLA